MTNASEHERVSLLRLIAGPAIISIVVTFLRLLGELQHWSPRWFNPESGGVAPQGVSWVIGIVWLPLPFGIYFARKLAVRGRAPTSAARAVGASLLGFVLFVSFFFLILPRLRGLDFHIILLLIWLSAVVAAALQWFGWRELCKTLLLYGLVSRAVVVLIMLLAMRGHWGTHYDYGRDADVAQLAFATKFWWLAFCPQLVFWVGFTIMLGALSGSITYAILPRRVRARATAAGAFAART